MLLDPNSPNHLEGEIKTEEEEATKCRISVTALQALVTVHCANTPNYLNRKKCLKVAMLIHLIKTKKF
jgi:hypothetical protein